MTDIVNIANSTIPAASQKSSIKYQDGTTGDIIREVIACYKQSYMQLKNFAPYLKGSTVKETCRNIWDFVKENIQYKIDPPGMQFIKEPVRLWADKQGDCKSFSVFAASCLSCLGINGFFRFVSFNESTLPTHVYVVVPYKNEEIIIDAVWYYFNEEKPFTHKREFSMTQIARLSGTQSSKPVIGSPFSVVAGQSNNNESAISGGVATVLYGAARKKMLMDNIDKLAIMGLYIFMPNGPDNGGYGWPKNISWPSSYAQRGKCPQAVLDKASKQFFNFWNFGDWAGIDVGTEFFQPLRDAQARLLGKDPVDWWHEKLSAVGINGIGDDGNGGGFGWLSIATSALGVVSKLFGSGAQWSWKYGEPSSFVPSLSDWGALTPNPLADLASQLNVSVDNSDNGGGIDYGNSTPIIDPNTTYNNLPTTDNGTQGNFLSQNPILVFGLVSAGALLLFKGKKKRRY